MAAPQPESQLTKPEELEILQATQCMVDMGISPNDIDLDRTLKLWGTAAEDIREIYCGPTSHNGGKKEVQKDEESKCAEKGEGEASPIDAVVRAHHRYILGYRHHFEVLWDIWWSEDQNELDFRLWAAETWIGQSKDYREMCIYVGEDCEESRPTGPSGGASGAQKRPPKGGNGWRIVDSA